MFDQNYFIAAAAATADDDDNKNNRAITNDQSKDIEAVTFQFLYQPKMISSMDTYYLCR